ncbi:hypothetical protein BDY19DRAFT_334699 [Irpex rosettiformis]|uniref:Uncharacterized protein n=1 Tax=Irpex rosettiformis TaxID=378272 RepID=A0ACB8TY40_9APHY|nr:hypothetical protein BDY19DRAFT_334699 [Irpex rosettiformis]
MSHKGNVISHLSGLHHKLSAQYSIFNFNAQRYVQRSWAAQVQTCGSTMHIGHAQPLECLPTYSTSITVLLTEILHRIGPFKTKSHLVFFYTLSSHEPTFFREYYAGGAWALLERGFVSLVAPKRRMSTVHVGMRFSRLMAPTIPGVPSPQGQRTRSS